MWDDIVGRWTAGDLKLDEELVCAMGRLLLVGSAPQDADDVLSLVEQTMNLPRAVPRMGDPARKTHHPVTHAPGARETAEEAEHDFQDERDAIVAPESLADVEAVPVEILDGEAAPDRSADRTPTFGTPKPGGEFDPIPLKARQVVRFAKPSHNTLSLLVDACTRMHASAAAQNYWGLLTAPGGGHNITPDADNYHMYLRLLRVNRASRAAATIVSQMVEPTHTGGLGVPPQAKTFRIALSACIRDGQNPNVLESARKLMDLMLQHLEEPDLKACDMYVDVLVRAISNRRLSASWQPLFESLRTLELVMTNLRSLTAFGNWRGPDSDSATRLLRNEAVVCDPEIDEDIEDLIDGNQRRMLMPRKLAVTTRGDQPRDYEAYRATRHLATRIVSMYDLLAEQGRDQPGIRQQLRWCRRNRDTLIARILCSKVPRAGRRRTMDEA
jgi:hypothetical protein